MGRIGSRKRLGYLCYEGCLHLRGGAQSASTLIGISVCLFSLCDTSLQQIYESNTYNYIT